MAKTRYGVSPWVHRLPDPKRPDYSRLSEDLVVDVAIVGGGLTGCATAYACASAGLKVALLESHRVGQGSSGRSAGLMLPEPGPMFRDLVQAHGVRRTRLVFETWRRGAMDAAALVRRLRIACDLSPVDALAVVTREDEKQLRREYEAREDAGLTARWVEPRAATQATSLNGASAMQLKDGCVVDPYRTCVGLAAAAVRRGVALFERSPVSTVRFGSAGVDVVTDRRTIRAATVVVTTGSATDEFRPLRRHFRNRETYLVLTEPVPPSTRAQLWSRAVTVGDGKIAHRRYRWVEGDRILAAGADQDEQPARHRDAVLVQRTGALMYDLLTTYPVISGLRPAYGWHCSYGETADGLMYVGAHRNYPHHLFALGGATASVTGAFVAARILARAACGAPEKGDEVFSWTR